MTQPKARKIPGMESTYRINSQGTCIRKAYSVTDKHGRVVHYGQRTVRPVRANRCNELRLNLRTAHGVTIQRNVDYFVSLAFPELKVVTAAAPSAYTPTPVTGTPAAKRQSIRSVLRDAFKLGANLARTKLIGVNLDDDFAKYFPEEA